MQKTQHRPTGANGARILYRALAVFLLAGSPAPLTAQSQVIAVAGAEPGAQLPPEGNKASTLTVAACRQMALEHQPAVAAARASLAAAVARSEALQRLHMPGLLSHDLRVRRQQSSLGVTVAQGSVLQAESDTLFAVNYTYLAALYARQQEKVAAEARRRLEDLKVVTQETLKAEERKDVLPEHRDLIEAYLKVVDGRSQEAIQGRARALAALREAMGVGCDFEIALPDRDLPCPQLALTKEQVVAMALERRGELLQAATAERIVGLEIDAQHAICLPSGRTFAAGSDIHARPLSPGAYGLEYHPAALSIEMPAQLAGSKQDRVEQAHLYHERAEAVVAKARQLVVLETEDAYLRWREKSVKAQNLRQAWQKSQKYSDRVRAKFDPAGKTAFPSLGEALNAGVVTTRLQIEALEAQFQSLAALAALERATAGGLCVDFDAPCTP
jgi:outer membrane protein TolC